MKIDHYFRLSATEGEHSFIEHDLREKCQESNMKVLYYRKIKTGHIPLIREVKVEGPFWRLLEIIGELDLRNTVVE